LDDRLAMPSPIRPLTKPEFDILAARRSYYYTPDRWTYMWVVCQIAAELIDRHALQSALELGPFLRPVIVGADAMERQGSRALREYAKVIPHDATITPWPIRDKQYDLFTALQVFEHLKGHQRAAFFEVCRVAKHAIISVPIDWEMEDPTDCHHRISNETAMSWFAPRRPTHVELGNGGSCKRVVYVFENIDGPETEAPPVLPPHSGARSSPALAVVGEIAIPRIGLVHPVYEGVATSVLNEGPGHWPGSPLPGKPGNVVLAGHRVKHPAPFRSIDQLEPGDGIVCRTGDVAAAYEVTEHFLVEPNGLWIADPTPGAILTIFACHPPHSTRQRYVVRARLVSVRRQGPSGAHLP
jgi:sortase A